VEGVGSESWARMKHDLIAAVDYARKARGSSPFVGITNGHGTMMFLRERIKITLKGLRIVDAAVTSYRLENGELVERALSLPACSLSMTPLSYQIRHERLQGACLA
jgi:hypothetical protein